MMPDLENQPQRRGPASPPDVQSTSATSTTRAAAQLIETLRVEPGNKVPLLAWHCRRLEQSCHALGYRWPGTGLIHAIEQQTMNLDPQQAHRLRLLLDANGGYSLRASPMPATPAQVRIHLSSAPLIADSLWLCHKTTHRPWYDEAATWLANNAHIFDLVFCNQNDEICEGSRSNVYMQNPSGVWLTPPLSSGLLAGVQRQALLDDGRVKEALILRGDFLNAKAVRISNALRGWLPAIIDKP